MYDVITVHPHTRVSCFFNHLGTDEEGASFADHIFHHDDSRTNEGENTCNCRCPNIHSDTIHLVNILKTFSATSHIHMMDVSIILEVLSSCLPCTLMIISMPTFTEHLYHILTRLTRELHILLPPDVLVRHFFDPIACNYPFARDG